ncbi:putative Universal stress protein [Candidatus Sulfobium mesophilum]|uniref:Putative Universal stress protein n=1 Tax=Candidatus Sulfobium mesophilum TaxID=2016548 RepID=A0A2U3QEC0_9BACT|nr:putative Universal stress protein [Candidatus Sulfobium mesophilum]
MKKILVGIDGSQESINALKYAAKMAKLTGAEILGVNVINEPSYREYYRDLSDKLKAEAEDILKKAVAEVEMEGVAIKTQVDVGSPDDVLAELAENGNNVVMIVVGASGRGRGSRVFVGSKTHALVNHIAAGLQCPIVVVPGNSDNFLRRL